MLLRAGEFSGAYYLAGYSLECALKACIAKGVAQHTFPDKKLANDVWIHDLARLTALANLERERLLHSQMDAVFDHHWDLATRWSEKSRYSIYSQQDCRNFVHAIADRQHGVMAWVRRYW
ncbi:MAG: DNA-binding protein [Acidobacteriota bacterium]